jgi:hypothetical protein
MHIFIEMRILIPSTRFKNYSLKYIKPQFYSLFCMGKEVHADEVHTSTLYQTLLGQLNQRG